MAVFSQEKRRFSIDSTSHQQEIALVILWIAVAAKAMLYGCISVFARWGCNDRAKPQAKRLI
jgi:hypothetical protein